LENSAALQWPIAAALSVTRVGDVRMWHQADLDCLPLMSPLAGIVLQKSKVAGLKIFRENTKQRAIADSYDLNRVTEVACEFCVRP
jgi:hypothetical protein